MSHITVTPLAGKTFGCRVEGIRLGALNDAAFAVLAQAFLQHQVVVVADCDPEPASEVAMYRRLETLWDGPQKPPQPVQHDLDAERAGSGRNLRGAHPSGRPEVSLLGNGAIREHYGLTGFLEPTPWWEKRSMQWHVDGSFDGKQVCVCRTDPSSTQWIMKNLTDARGVQVNVCTMMSCYETASSGITHTIRYEMPSSGASLKAGSAEESLSFRGGATCFASTYDAYELCSPAEKDYLDGLKVRYWSNPSGFGRVRTDVYPCMSPCGTRVMSPPPKPDGPAWQSIDSKASSWSKPSGSDDDSITLAQQMMSTGVSRTSSGGSEAMLEGESTEGFQQPLILVHPQTGRRSVFVHTVNMMRLEEADGTPLSWEASQQLICKLFQRVVLPERAVVHNWSPGEVVFWDNRCCLHSVTPTDNYKSERRLMHRISLASVYKVDEAAVSSALAKL